MVITFSTPYEYNGGNLCFNIWAATSSPSVSWYGVSTDYNSCGYDWSITPPVSSPYQVAKFLPKAEFTFTAGSSSATAPGVTTNNTPTNLTDVSVTLGGTITDMGGATGVYAGICYSTTNTPTTSDSHVESRYTSATAYSKDITSLLPNTTYYYRAFAYNSANSLADPTYGDVYSFTTAGTITLNQPANGEISASVEGGTATTSSTYALPNQSVTLTATPSDGYSLDCWNVTGVTGTANGNTYTFTMPSNNVTATATFVPTPGGTSTTTAWAETTSINTSNNYLIGLVSDNDVYLVLNYNPTNSSYYYNNSSSYLGYTALATIDGNGHVTGCTGVASDLLYAQWTFETTSGGKITSVQNTGRYLYGYTYTSYGDCYPNTSSTSWTYSDNYLTYLISGATQYLHLKTVNNNKYIERSTIGTTVRLYTPTEVTTYAIVATANLPEGGTVAGTDYYANGASCTLTATPAFGYDFVNWTENGTVVSTDAEYTFTVSSARTLVANFESQGSCLKPTDLAQVANTEAAHQAQLSWTENNDATEWQVVYSTNSEFDPDAATPTPVNNNPATITGLAQATTYYAYVRTVCGPNDQSGWSNKATFATISGHLAPTSVSYDASTLTAHEVTVTWNGVATNVNHQSYDLYFSTDPVMPQTPVQSSFIGNIDAESYGLTGLTSETTYYVWVRDNCGDANNGGDGYSDWTGPVSFTTEISCPAPTNFTADDITNHTATLNWEGNSASYIVSYRTAAYTTDGTEETFDNNSIPTGWTKYTGLLSEVMGGTALTTTTSGWNFGTKNDVFNSSHSYINIWSTSIKYWLVSPQTEVPNGAVCSFDLALTKWSSLTPVDPTQQLDDKFVVLISTDNKATWTILRQWDNDDATTGDIYAVYNNIACSATGEFVSIDLSAYAGENVYIAFYGESTVSGGDNALHIDNVAIGTPVAAGTWQNATPEGTTANLTGLLADRKYDAKVQGNCGDNDLSREVSITFTTDIPCPAPTGLQIVDNSIKSNQVGLTWTKGYADAWQVCYNDGTDHTVAVATADVNIEGNTVTYTLNSLSPETDYTVKVRENCGNGDGNSEWTTELSFSTIASCSVEEASVDYITHHTATVNWTGESADGFTVNYRTAAGNNASMLNEDFTGLTSGIPAGWDNSEGTTTYSSYKWNYHNSGHEAAPCLRFNSYNNSNNYTNFLMTPSRDFPEGKTMQLTFWWKNPAGGDFSVYISTDGGTTKTALKEGLTGQSTWKQETIDLTDYVDATNVTIHFKGTSNYGYGDAYIYLDDVVLGEITSAGTWQTETAASDATSADLSNLDAGLDYEVFVSPNCDNTIKSDTITFTTVSDNKKYFITAGNWCEDANWMDGEIPALTDDVIIRANANIESGCVAEAKKITFDGTPTPTLTIADGGQLVTNTAVSATVQKVINAHGTTTADGGWYFIASPINSSYYSATSSGLNLITDNYGSNIPNGESATYDLYRFNQNPTIGDDGIGKEWMNYRKNTFSLANGKGYLYASLGGTTLNFSGSIKPCTSNVSIDLDYTEGVELAGWNLVGNPFTFNAAVNVPYYTLGENGTAIPNTTKQEPVPPCTGILVQATGANQTVTFSKPETDGSAPSNGNLNIALTQANVRNNSIMDKAIISFNEGNDLSKFYFGQSNAYIYIPQDNKKFAIVSSEGEGEMPLNFRANENGSYTLNFGSQNVSFSYLHLIDNMTGNDIDLLQTPSYTFNATTTDYSSRFRLVFCTGINNDSDSFAFFSNGNWIIGNEGEATLQVVDVTGRILSSETVNGSVSKAINAAPGVYMIRLINGDNVKVQKIVVR